jgi:hypothetical protein
VVSAEMMVCYRPGALDSEIGLEDDKRAIYWN